MKKPMELADQLVREHADRIADTVTRVHNVKRCVQFDVFVDRFDAQVVRSEPYGTYCVLCVVDGNDAWSTPSTPAECEISERIVAYCVAHDAEIRLAIDAALTPNPPAAQGDGTNEDSLDADWKDDGFPPGMPPEMAAEFSRRLAEVEDARFNADLKDGGA